MSAGQILCYFKVLCGKERIQLDDFVDKISDNFPAGPQELKAFVAKVTLLLLLDEFEHKWMGLMCEQVEHNKIVMVYILKQVMVVVFVLVGLLDDDGEADSDYCLSFSQETLFDSLSFILGHLNVPKLCESAASCKLYVSFGVGQKLNLIFAKGKPHIFEQN